MTIQEIFDYVDEIKRNSFSKLVKTIWLNELEGKIQNEIMLLAQPECIRYVYESTGTLSGISFPDKRSLQLRSPIKCHEGGLLTLSGLETYAGNNLSGLEILNISKDKLTLTFAENTFPEVGDDPDSGSFSFEGKDTEVLVKNPFDRIYAPWILAKISEHLEESNQAANYIAKFKDEWEIFAAWYATTYRPADGKPMFLGYYLRGNDGDRGKQGEQGEDGTGIVRLFIESNRLKYELTDGTISDAGPVSGIEIDPTLAIEGAAADAKVVGEEVDRLNDTLNEISVCIPSQASYMNQLADKAFVNSSIGTNTAYYISDNGQPFTSLAQLQAYSGTVTNNDYAFVVGTDSAGNTTYTRYKYNADTQTWAAEFVLNNSSFTAAQWAAIESNITAALVASYNAHIADGTIHVTAGDKTAWNGKLDKTGGVVSGDLTVRGNLLLGDCGLSEINTNTISLVGEHDNDHVRVTNVDTPVNDYDAAPKKYVDEHSGGGAFTVIELMTADEVSLLPDGAYVSRDDAGTWDYWLKGEAFNVVTIYQFECMDDNTSSFDIYVGTAGNVETRVAIEASGGLSIGDMSLYASGEELKFNNKAIALKSDLYDLDDRVTYLEEHGGGGGESKWTSEATELLITILRNAAYKAEHDQSSNIEALDALLNETATLVSIEATYTQGATVVYPTTSLDSLKSELVVIATYDDESTVTLNANDYTLSGTLTEGTSTITATYQGKNDTFIVAVSAEPVVPILDYISAVYTQSDTVYPSTALADLKADLAVTAHLTDESTQIVNAADYTLSGTLAVGTSVVTVSYEGKTTTFNVAVSDIPAPVAEYALHQVAGYGGQFDTGKGTHSDHVAKIEVTLAIPQPKTTATKVVFSGFLGWFGFSNNEWKAEHPVEAFAVDRPFSEVVGNGKQTITITGLGTNWATIKTGYSTHSYNPELTWYEIKMLDASNNVIADFKPTANVGEMYDSISDSTSNFPTTNGLTVSEVTV